MKLNLLIKKRLAIFAFLLGLCYTLHSQDQEGARVVTVSQASSTQASNSNQFYVQVGLPYLGITTGSVHTTTPVDVRFPWHILYLYDTFAEETFTVSKGYFTDKVKISWNVRANQDLISGFYIYRKEIGAEEYVRIASLGSFSTEYEDEYIEGGQLYEYKVEAIGVSAVEEKYKTFMEGIGFRSPSGIVTGRISFEGGNPVRDVAVLATSATGTPFRSSAISIPENSSLKINQFPDAIDDRITFQAWVRPVADFTNTGDALTVFSLANFDGTLEKNVNVKLFTGAVNYLEVDIDGGIYTINNYYPSGQLNARGDDILNPITAFNSEFIHFSIVLEDGQIPVLYINGRQMNEAYAETAHAVLVDLDANYTAPHFSVVSPTSPINLDGIHNGVETHWERISFGSQKAMLIDEIRVWNRVLTESAVYTDYKRIIDGNDVNLISYLRMDEAAGDVAYDMSHAGFSYNNNNAAVFAADATIPTTPNWVFGENTPNSDQLGILGVTDINGNYIISAIPYSGAGETYTITPILGIHEFDPSQQLVYIGETNTVINSVNFTDTSSFVFKGKIFYDSRDVFKSFVEVNSPDPDVPSFTDLTDGDQYVSGPGLIDEGYNYYEKGVDKFSKGDYWLNDAGTAEDTSDDYLERYARIPSEGVSIYIDNEIVLDSNNTPIVSDSNGEFEINVPIGEHYISIRRDGHEFGYSGRFPADPTVLDEFFEDREEQVTFIDQTKVTLVGRVVGGAVESAKPIGFGHEGTVSRDITDSNGFPQTTVVTSVNNIGTASITFDYTPAVGGITAYTKANATTNTDTGEYRLDLLPLGYSINQTNGVSIASNSTLNILDAVETINVSRIQDSTIPSFEYSDGTTETGLPYAYEKSFTHRSTPVLSVTEQTSESDLERADGTTISTEGFDYLVYKQFQTYSIEMNRFEPYSNSDDPDAVLTFQVPVLDGELIINNNLALADSESEVTSETDPSISTYTFRGGVPSINAPFTKTLSINYRLNGVDSAAQNYETEGILLGGQSDGSQTFVTSAPDKPDMILRDPPGSNSQATISSGETVSFTTETDFTNSSGISTEFKVLLGVKFAAGGGLAGPVIESQGTNSPSLGIAVTASSTNAEKLTKTYSFSQSISTSSDTSFVGADGDLYIGQSKNYFYGSYDDIDVRASASAENFTLTNSDGETVFIGKQKAVYFAEEPSDTFFVFSQFYIVNTLIPELQGFVTGLEDGTIDPSTSGVLTIEQYQTQINLWRSTIRENERLKYLALNDRANYKAGLETTLDTFIAELTDALDQDNDPLSEAELTNNLESSTLIRDLLNTNFEDNVSIDNGVGQFTRSVETAVVSTSSSLVNLNADESFALDLGFNINGVGLLNTTGGFVNQDINTSFSTEETATTSISYTLVESDPGNVLSIDVVNSFDGNGPIFITRGGRTSCPYEGVQKSIYYNPATYVANDPNIIELAEGDRQELSLATQQIEVPQITAEVVDVSNVPEDVSAEFRVQLENISTTRLESDYILRVNPSSNPNSAIINIPSDGILFPSFQYGVPREFVVTIGKSLSDVYDYDDIEIVFESLCGGDASDSVTLSAHFVPSCSNVVVSAPLDNWVYNISEAYNLDGTSNPLAVELSEYTTGFSSFQKLDLQYRSATSSTWTRLHTYYGTQDFYDEAVINNETEISVITETTINYPWDIVGQNIQNGTYEIRAISTCTNDTSYISEVITGKVDLFAPRAFGTPTPIDGILGYGEDISVRFNEAIFYNSSVSLIEIKGETNQLPINNNVSLYFNGSTNTATIESPYIQTGDFSFEFWMNNQTEAGTASIVDQERGINIDLQGSTISFQFGDSTVSGGISSDNLFHHYTFTYDSAAGVISIFEDDRVVQTDSAPQNLQYNFDANMVFGGNTFIGNLHDVRLWSKALNFTDAYANIYTKYVGNELDLVGYWPMNEGHGNLAHDIARFKHAQVNAAWDIKPKGEAYEFAGGQYLTLDNVAAVQLTNEMNATLSFWVKTDQTQNATIFSNGRGDDTDIAAQDGTRNKWAVNLNGDGNLSFENENNSYNLTTTSITDNQWHHVSILINRFGNLKTYVDAALVSTNPTVDISSFYGNKMWLGARGHIDLAGTETVDRAFSGSIDEFRLWNTLRSFEQIERDRFFEVDTDSAGLLVYSKMNAPDTPTGNGPRYYHIVPGPLYSTSLAVMNAGTVNYTIDVPPIKPARNTISFQISHVINGDQMIMEPVVSSLAAIEGQVLDITVHRMFDEFNNMQASPITWTAYVNKDQVDWYIDEEQTVSETELIFGDEKTYTILVVNSGGTFQDFSLLNVPNWLTVSQSSGLLSPNSSIEISAMVDSDLAAGYYEQDMFLRTEFGFDQKIQLKLNIFSDIDWTLDPNDFQYSMNVIGKIMIDGVFDQDTKDKLGVFYNEELRGVGQLTFDPNYQEYFVYLTIYSNTASGEILNFNIWDASEDKILVATLDGEETTEFILNRVLGSNTNPALFENTTEVSQSIGFNQGYTWISFPVQSSTLSDVNAITSNLDLETNDLMLSHSPSLLETYFNDPQDTDNSSWSGSISDNGGFSTTKMYKVRLENAQTLDVLGTPVDLSTWTFPISENWNWLPYVVGENVRIGEALSDFIPSVDDVIKSQNEFAIYDALNGWSGTLSYLETGKGYMLRSSSEQEFKYPNYLSGGRRMASESSSSTVSSETQSAFNAFSQNMNAVIQLPEGYTNVYAYNTAGELHGHAVTQMVNGNELSFMTIVGDTSQNQRLVFHIGDGDTTKQTSNTINFSADSILGTTRTPYIIDEDAIDLSTSQFMLYPNPSKDGFVYLEFYAQNNQKAQVRIHNMLNQLLFDMSVVIEKGHNRLKIPVNFQNGTYFLNTTIDNEVHNNKIILNEK